MYEMLCDVTHSYASWQIHVWKDWFPWHMTHSRWRSKNICLPNYIYVFCWSCNQEHRLFIQQMVVLSHTWIAVQHASLMWHDSFIRDMTRPYVTHSYGTWLIHMGHDSFICDMTHSYVTCLIHMWHDSFIWGSPCIWPYKKCMLPTHAHMHGTFYIVYGLPKYLHIWMVYVIYAHMKSAFCLYIHIGNVDFI